MIRCASLVFPSHLRLESIQYGGCRSRAVDQDEAETSAGMCQTEPRQDIRPSSLAQANYVFDMEEVQHGHQVLSEYLETGKLEAGKSRERERTK